MTARDREAALLEAVRAQPIPEHVAIIMDGNGRWATGRGLPRIAGHREGVKAARTIVRAADALGLRFLTLYAFSTENWSRPLDEVSMLMNLLERSVPAELPEFMSRNARLRVLGQTSRVPVGVRRGIDHVVHETRNNTGLTVLMAFNYGGRDELLDAFRTLARQVQAGELKPEDITEKELSGALYTADVPDPDLLIRTSGEMRISNFLLWQIAYTELLVTPVLWPDFGASDLYQAVAEFQRGRGGLGKGGRGKGRRCRRDDTGERGRGAGDLAARRQRGGPGPGVRLADGGRAGVDVPGARRRRDRPRVPGADPDAGEDRTSGPRTVGDRRGRGAHGELRDEPLRDRGRRRPDRPLDADAGAGARARRGPHAQRAALDCRAPVGRGDRQYAVHRGLRRLAPRVRDLAPGPCRRPASRDLPRGRDVDRRNRRLPRRVVDRAPPARAGAEPAEDHGGRRGAGGRVDRRGARARGMAHPGLQPGRRRRRRRASGRDRAGGRSRRVGDQAKPRNQGRGRAHPRPRRHARSDRWTALQRSGALLLLAVRMVPTMKQITLLGATGSIGLRTLDLVSSFPEEFSVAGLAARGSNVERIADLCKKYAPRVVALLEPESRDRLARLLPTTAAPLPAAPPGARPPG